MIGQGELHTGLSEKLHVAKVVDNKDPKMWGRVRARVEGMFDNIPDNHLPWALPQFQHKGGASVNHGTFDVPEVGSEVLLEFQGGSAMNPIYNGGTLSEATVLPEAKINYPRRRVALWPSGSMILHDDESQDVFIRNVGDMHLYITGNVFMKVDGNVTEHIKGDRLTVIDGKDSLVVKGDHRIHSANMYHTASGNHASEAGGNHTVYAGGNALRDAGGIIHDDSGGGARAGSAPGLPSFPQWEGVRGATP